MTEDDSGPNEAFAGFFLVGLLLPSRKLGRVLQAAGRYGVTLITSLNIRRVATKLDSRNKAHGGAAGGLAKVVSCQWAEQGR